LGFGVESDEESETALLVSEDHGADQLLGALAKRRSTTADTTTVLFPGCRADMLAARDGRAFDIRGLWQRLGY